MKYIIRYNHIADIDECYSYASDSRGLDTVLRNAISMRLSGAHTFNTIDDAKEFQLTYPWFNTYTIHAVTEQELFKANLADT